MTKLWDGPIIDAHHHFWDPSINDHPWLAPEANIPFRYGDYSAIKRRYFPEDYFADAGTHRVVQTVYVETEWNPQDPIGETRFIEQLAARYGVPNAIVAQAWLDRPDAIAVLTEQAAFKCVRSVRHKPGGPTSPEQVGHQRSLMSDEYWRRSYAALEGLGLHFDLQTPWWNLHEAERLARDFPGITLILNHAGLPSDRSAEGLAGWRLAMARLAQWPNVQVKISGLG
ncbi:thioesterase, partial [Pseudomonas sp. HMWF031]